MQRAVDLPAQLTAPAAQTAQRLGVGDARVVRKRPPAGERPAKQEPVEVAVETFRHRAPSGPLTGAWKRYLVIVSFPPVRKRLPGPQPAATGPEFAARTRATKASRIPRFSAIDSGRSARLMTESVTIWPRARRIARQ